MKKVYLLTVTLFIALLSIGQTITMSTTTTTGTCSGTFLDPGGTGNYSNNVTRVQTFIPSAGNRMSFNFTSFNTESGFDYLYVYNGNSTAAPLMGTYSGTTSPGTIASTAADGALTFRFVSDAGTTRSGWSAAISCVPVPYRAQFTASSLGSSTWCPGETRDITVTVKNNGTAAWTSGGAGVNLSYWWTGQGQDDNARQLPFANLLPTQSQTITISVTAPLTGPSELNFDLVREGACWFRDNVAGCSGPGNSVYTTAAQTIVSGPAPTGTATQSFCAAASPTVANLSATGTNIKWYAAASGGAPLATTTPLANGTHYYASQTNVSGCESTTRLDVTAVVYAGVPSAPGTITAPASICSGTAGTFSVAAVAGATSYTWSVSGTGWSVAAASTTNSISINMGTGLGTVSVTANNTCGASPAQVLSNITPTPAPAIPGTITQPTLICGGSTGNSFSIAPVAGATSYTWVVTGTGWSVTAGGTTTNATITAGTGAGTVTVRSNNTCGSSSYQTTGTINPSTVPSSPGAITGTAASCPNTAGLTYSIAAVSGATGYTWSVPTGWNITAGQGTTNITVTSGNAGQNGNITVVATNGCGASALGNQVINITPTNATNATGYTQGTTKTSGTIQVASSTGRRGYLRFPLSGIPADATIVSSTLSLTNNGSGALSGVVNSVTALDNTDPLTASANALFSAIGNGALYNNDTWGNTGTIDLDLNAAATDDIQNRIGGYLGLGLNRGAGSSVYQFYGYTAGALAPVLSVTYTQATYAVTVNALPANKALTAQASAVCPGAGTNIVVASSINGVTYQLRNNADNSPIGTALNGNSGNLNLPTGALTVATTFNVLATTTATGCSVQMANTPTVTINALALDKTVQAVASSVCAGTGTNIQVLASQTGVSYQLRNAANVNIGGAINGNNLTLSFPTGNLTATTTFNILATVNATGCGKQLPMTATVSVDAAAIADAGSALSVCQTPSPSALTLSGASVSGAATTGTWSIISGGGILSNTSAQNNAGIASTTYTPAANFSGTVTLRLTTNNPGTACGAVSDDRIITVDPRSTAFAGNPVAICQSASPGPITLTGATIGGGASNGTWTVSPAGSGTFNSSGGATSDPLTNPASEQFLPTSNFQGVITLTLTSNKTGSCVPVTSTKTITVNEAATVTAGALTYLCASPAPTAVALTGATFGGSATSASWSILSGGGTLSSGAATTTPSAITYTPAANFSGTVTLILTATDPDGAGPCSTVSATRTIIISPAPAITSVVATPAVICAGDVSNLVVSAATLPAISLINENFNGVSSFTATGSVTGFNFGTSWMGVNSPYNDAQGTFTSPDNSKFMFASENIFLGGSTTSVLTSNTVNTTGLSGLTLNYQHAIDKGGFITNHSGKVEVSTNGGGSWTTLKNYTGSEGSPNAFASDNIDMSAYANQTNLKIRFNYSATSVFLGNSYWALDNVILSGTPAAYKYAWTAAPSATAGLPAGAATANAANANINVTPSVTTTYNVTQTNYLGCTSTGTVTVTVNQGSGAPVSASASPATICAGSNTTLTQAGGTLGTGAIWHWYTDAAFTQSAGTSPAANASLVVSPSATTTYYVRAEGGTAPCAANTIARSVTVTVNQPSVAPTAAVATPAAICAGSTTTLTQTGGTLGTGATWHWYTNAAFTVSAGTSNAANASLVVTPTGNTTYYVRAEGGTAPCATGNTSAANVSVTINPAATASITGTTTLCAGSSTTISFTATPNTTITYNISTGGNATIAVGPSGSASLNTGALSTTTTYSLVSVAYTASPACTQTVNGSATVTVTPAGTWLGLTSNWHSGSNWCGGNVPTSATNVVIPVMTAGFFYPVISSTATVNNLTVDNGATINIGSATLRVAGSITASANNINAATGVIEMTGTGVPQNISGSSFTGKAIGTLTSFNNAGLNISNAANDTLKVLRAIGFDASVSNSFIEAGGNLVLVSTVNGTASLGKIKNGNIISGNAISERFINTGNAAGQHGKSWQFVSANTTGSTIKNSWMEAGAPTPRYGAWITDPSGTGNGFDNTSLAPSMKYYNSGTDLLVGVGNPTTTQLKNPFGYMLYVRGDRTVNSASGANSAPKPTTLRAKGNLVFGTQAPITVTKGKLQAIGNPYPSAIDFLSLLETNGKIDSLFYVWDPTLLGSYNGGGYQTFAAATGFVPTPGGGTIYPFVSNYTTIESGQAFFVKNSFTTDGTITFTEDAKTDGSKLVSRGSVGHGPIAMLSTILVNNAGLIADGNRVVFNNGYSNSLDRSDAPKVANSGENFGMLRDAKTLAVEARKQLSATDTIFYKMSGLQTATYNLAFAVQNIPHTNLQAELVDKFLNSRTPVSLMDSTIVSFTTTSAAASKAADRFMLVFRSVAGPLPVNITSISANRNSDRSIAVSWKTENEINLQKYEVERSADGRSFTGILTAAPTAVNGGSASYLRNDLSPLSADNFYRIKATSLDGTVQYSAIVKVAPLKEKGSIGVYPNPVVNKNVQVQFKGQNAGTYRLQLTNKLGQVVYSGTAEVTGGVFVKAITLNETAAAGNYQLQVVAEDGTTTTQQVIVQ